MHQPKFNKPAYHLFLQVNRFDSVFAWLSLTMTIFEGSDCIGNAKTGSGKTIAFALPILQKLSVDPYGIFALVLTPTRYRIYLFISPQIS
jgi:hypothetical protein